MRCLLCARPLMDDLSLAELLGGHQARLPQLCRRCQATFSRIDQTTCCPGCGRALPAPVLCTDCVRWEAREAPLLHHRALFIYDEVMKAFIQSYKGNGDYRLHSAFADLLAGQFSKNAVLVPLTSEPSHLRARGFDPVLGLFGRLRLARWLTKGDTDLPQAQKDRRGRLQTAQSFSATLPRGHARIRHVILLDDLYTTGRTLYHARNALRDAGYQGQITSFSLIR